MFYMLGLGPIFKGVTKILAQSSGRTFNTIHHEVETVDQCDSDSGERTCYELQIPNWGLYMGTIVNTFIWGLL